MLYKLVNCHYICVLVRVLLFHQLSVKEDVVYQKCQNLTWQWGAQRHKDHGSDRVPQSHSAAEVGGQVTDDGREEADNTYGHEEAGPTIPVLGRGHTGKKNLPEHSQKVHDIVGTGGQTLFAAFVLLLISITWRDTFT